LVNDRAAGTDFLTLMELWQTLSGMVIDWHLTAPFAEAELDWDWTACTARCWQPAVRSESDFKTITDRF